MGANLTGLMLEVNEAKHRETFSTASALSRCPGHIIYDSLLPPSSTPLGLRESLSIFNSIAATHPGALCEFDFDFRAIHHVDGFFRTQSLSDVGRLLLRVHHMCLSHCASVRTRP